jgi:hypothetical protein
MTEPILVCECGMRVVARGAKPGRVGRCPRCGGRLRVPDDFPAENTPQAETRRPLDRGYALGAEAPADAEAHPDPDRRASFRSSFRTARTGPAAPGAPAAEPSFAAGILPPLAEPEAFWLESFVYPARGAECLGVLIGVAALFWVGAVLVPEYCLTLRADAESLGAGLLGTLFTVICTVPDVILAPFVLAFWLQYLGRVLVSSAMGETIPPRSPDRNFDGFFNGLGPWFVWLVLGAGVGMLPAGWYVYSRGLEPATLWNALPLALLGVPYVLAALMLSFLHDRALAAMPGTVLASLFRLGASFLGASALVALSVAGALASFRIAFVARGSFFWLYIVLCLGSSILAHWLAIGVMRLLGVYYFHHRDSLRWHREHPRWGTAWRL